eukprot:CAMPEP_0172000504 /NCGR_PEP_ID=MMETSP1041-20130122/2346_1 /TAXON_ID=464988 /ORGANISM="Hemiselmis andersenii, Strain CCMP439" /LENGTH=182 /DNA_ID=CAMNT_0012654031 /DNA_START=527 /DNA_END=1072 /DNA_ORIENTATION=-
MPTVVGCVCCGSRGVGPGVGEASCRRMTVVGCRDVTVCSALLLLFGCHTGSCWEEGDTDEAGVSETRLESRLPTVVLNERVAVRVGLRDPSCTCKGATSEAAVAPGPLGDGGRSLRAATFVRPSVKGRNFGFSLSPAAASGCGAAGSFVSLMNPTILRICDPSACPRVRGVQTATLEHDSAL